MKQTLLIIALGCIALPAVTLAQPTSEQLPPPPHVHGNDSLHHHPPKPSSHSGTDAAQSAASASDIDALRQSLLLQIIAIIEERFGITLNLDIPESKQPAGSQPVMNHTPQGMGPGGTHQEFIGGDTKVISSLSLPDSEYYGAYEIDDSDTGSEVTVTLSETVRSIMANALPNHETGEFPNSGNPNSISAQANTYTFPVTGEYTGEAVWVREPGVAINGVKFEPETAEMVTCSSGESYKIEALQEMYDLGFDMNNAHVQPDGTYHYHGVSDLLVDSVDDGSDLVHVGFAADGHYIYYDTSDTVQPSYALKSADRSGSSCTYRNNPVAIEDTEPDGTYVSDWEYDPSVGNLDACNGAIIDGEYAYFVTDTYPFISRCLQGEL